MASVEQENKIVAAHLKLQKEFHDHIAKHVCD